jgi:hypothetical protein
MKKKNLCSCDQPVDESRGWIKLMRTEHTEALLHTYPNAFRLLTQIALRGRRTDSTVLGLQRGEALIGDYKSIGLTRQKYRTALQLLCTLGFLTIKTTNRGTIAKLVGTSVYDINIETDNQQLNHQITIKQPSDNHQITTNKEDKKIKREEKKKKIPSPPEGSEVKAVANDATKPMSKKEAVEKIVNEIEIKLFPVSNRKRIEVLLRAYSFEVIVAAIERCVEYFKIAKKNKWKYYVFAKRFSKFIENIATFTDAEAFEDRLRLMEKWHRDPDGKIDRYKQWCQVGAPREEPPEKKDPPSEQDTLIRMMNHAHGELNSLERLLADREQRKKFPDEIKEWEHKRDKAKVEYENLLQKIEALDKVEPEIKAEVEDHAEIV